MNYAKLLTFLASACILGSPCFKLQACEQAEGQSVPVAVYPNKLKEYLGEKTYAYQVFQLAIEKSVEKYGPCTTRLQDRKTPIHRVEANLEQGMVHAAELTATKKRDARFKAVPFPVSKGLIGHRLFLIKEGDSERFANIKTREDLAKLKAGQGNFWDDTKILKLNDLDVIAISQTISLIDMLTESRFDYFPRGSNEIAAELMRNAGYDIELEQNLVLSYPLMSAFYVAKENTDFYERLSYGMERAINDGSFDALFNSHTTITTVLEDYKLLDRTFIFLCNPLMPEWIPVNEDKYWVIPWPKHKDWIATCAE